MEALTRRNLFRAAGAATAGAAAAATIGAAPASADPPVLFDGYVTDEGGEVVNITNPGLGAKGDTVVAPSGGSIVAGTNNLNVSSPYQFVAADVGKVVTIQGAGLNGAVLSTTITSITSPDAGQVGRRRHESGHQRCVLVRDRRHRRHPPGHRSGRLVEDTSTPPAGIYTIRGASNNGDTGGGNQIPPPVPRRSHRSGGQVRPAGQHLTSEHRLLLRRRQRRSSPFSGHARYEGFMVDGNNIATAQTNRHRLR